MARYAGAGWVRRAFGLSEMSLLGEAVADLLGDVFEGIYHLNRTSLSKVDWMEDGEIEFALNGSLSTFDDDTLTRLVVLAHDRMLRVAIRGAAPWYMRLTISQQPLREDGSRVYPAIEKATEQIRAKYRSD